LAIVTHRLSSTGTPQRRATARRSSCARFVLTLDAEDAGPDGEVVTRSTTAKIWLRGYVGVTNASQADAGLELPDEHDDRAILEETHARRIDLTTMGEFWIGPTGGPPTLLVGLGQIPEPAISTAVSELGQAVQATLARA
jgi:hypothetical protein